AKYLGFNFLVSHGHPGDMRAIDRSGRDGSMRVGALPQGALCPWRRAVPCPRVPAHSCISTNPGIAVPISASGPSPEANPPAVRFQRLERWIKPLIKTGTFSAGYIKK